MTTETLTLTDFLLARIEDDEALAQDALERGFGGWEWLADAGINFEARTHIVAWHPARVLAEAEAKRRIVERYRAIAEGGGGTAALAFHEQGLFEALTFLATAYAGHPDYRDEWRQ